MTESEWLTSTDPKLMLDYLRGKASERKLRLLTCACCRRAWKLLADKYSRKPFLSSLAVVGRARRSLGAVGLAGRALAAVGKAAGCLAYPGPPRLADAQREQLSLFRDIFGNPFRPAAIIPVWPMPTVSNLAKAAYQERALPSGELDAARLAVLADALEEAGCHSAEILTHLRGPGPHVRGCWVVGLCLGKS